MVDVTEKVDALLAQAESLRAELLERRQERMREIDEIDAQLRRLPGSERYPDPVSVEQWRHRRMQVQASDVGRPGIAINAHDIMHAAARFYGMTVSDLQGRDRHASQSRARGVAMYLVKKISGAESFPEIGRLFGSRDHTTCISAVKRIEEQLPLDAELAAEVQTLTTVIEEAQAMRTAHVPRLRTE